MRDVLTPAGITVDVDLPDRMKAALAQAAQRANEAGLPLPASLDDAALAEIYRLAYDAYQAERFEDAVGGFAALVAARGDCPAYLMGLGMALQRLGRCETALPIFAAAALQDIASPGPLLRVGECLLALERPDDAVDVLLGVIDLCYAKPDASTVGDAARALIDLIERRTR